MRAFVRVVLFVVAVVTPASGQAINPEFVHGREYSFERMVAKRVVNDAQDKGTIRLVTYVYRPLKNDRHQAVLFSHGSTAGLARSPKEALDAPPAAVVRFFVSRGYTLVAPMRRGRGESSGTYVEECSVYIGRCTVAEQTALLERQLREAILDSNAVIDQVILRRLVPRQSKILAAGISRGGFLSLMLAGERPEIVNGIVNFVGGWTGVTENLTAQDIQRRMDEQKTMLTRAAKRASAPSIWFYATRDPFYKEGVPQELHRYWQDAGGRAEFVYIDDPRLPPGHTIAPQATFWERKVDAFLHSLAAGKR